MNADRILVLSGGRVAEMGTHASLMEQDGIYRKVFGIQSAGYDAADGAPEGMVMP